MITDIKQINNLLKSKILFAFDFDGVIADSDKVKRDEIDTRNSAEQLIYQSEKQLKDLDEQLSEDNKKTIWQNRILSHAVGLSGRCVGVRNAAGNH